MRPPELPQLKAGLTRVLSKSVGRPVEVEIGGRRPNPYQSTSASEIVDCRLGDAPPLVLLCKYGGDTPTLTGAVEYYGDIAYEGDVYQNVLARTDCSVPRFYGSFHEPDSGRRWLVLEYLGGGQSVSKMVYQYPLSLAAAWIGRFHMLHEDTVCSPRFSFLTRYDQWYYHRWVQRVLRLSGSLGEKAPWMAELCTAFLGPVADRLLSHTTVIHGEYYPKNVLIRDGTVYPIDWECAAVAAGEIDLAALTEGWPEEESRACQRAYVEARWQGRGPSGFEQRLDAARIYFQLRWLGGRYSNSTSDSYPQWRLELMYQCGRRLGIL